uniref:Uncharacterized protein n=1 Tax=Alexandrium andersonii TaxID=327968 RepID=A0A7S2CDK1_9DINO
MPRQQAALGLGRALLQRPASARPPLSRARLLAALLPERRGLASGRHFNGFPFGAGFPGGPPPGDSEKFYRILGVEKSASDAEIKQAYKKQAMKHHPDRGGDEGTFKEISRAYEVLSNPDKKQIYDMHGEQGLESMEQGGGGGPQGGMDPMDLFSQIFGINLNQGRQRGRPVTPDSTYELQVTLEELYNGTNRSIVFTRDAVCSDCKGIGGHNPVQCRQCNGTGRQVHMQQMGLFVQHVETACSSCSGRGYVVPPSNTCKTCRGSGLVKEKKTFAVDIEPGSQDRMEFRFRGQADEAPGKDTGDVVIIVRQKPHRTFQRVKDNLVMAKKITLAEALCGFQFSTTFLDGEDLVIRSEPGEVMRPKDVLRIPGRGMPRPHGQKPGDLFLLLDIEFPKSLPPDSCEELAEMLGGRPLPEEKPADGVVPRKLSKAQMEQLSQNLNQQSRRENLQDQCFQQ